MHKMVKFARLARLAKFELHLPNSPFASLASPRNTAWQMLVSLHNTAWQMSASLASHNINTKRAADSSASTRNIRKICMRFAIAQLFCNSNIVLPCTD
jgi:hypothetical protein